MNRDDDLCRFRSFIPEYNTRMAVEYSLNRGFKALMDEIERVGRTPDWSTLVITISPEFVRQGLVMCGDIVATGPKMTKEMVEAQIQIAIGERKLQDGM